MVEKERAQALADEYGLHFMETSAKSNVNVDEAFMHLARYTKASIMSRVVNDVIGI